MEKTVNLRQLGGLRQYVGEFSNLSDDYILLRITESDRPEQEDVSGRKNSDGPIRIDGMACILCFGGALRIEKNLIPCELTANTLTVIDPGSIIEMKGIEWDKLDCYMLFVSLSFLHDVNFDVNLLGSFPPVGERHTSNTFIHLIESEAEQLKEYFMMLARNTMNTDGSLFTRSIARNLIAALTYQIIQFFMVRKADVETSPPRRSRRSGYVHDFMKLVHDHHRRERSVSFYASRLFISPKYLSLLVKEHIGQSASDLIDSYVILEAKNLLRFSGKNIQQVAYELNFPNQSSFGKYFKHLTGMSPSEYQKT